MADWAHSRLRRLYAASSFPLQVTMASGKVVDVDAVGFWTLLVLIDTGRVLT